MNFRGINSIKKEIVRRRKKKEINGRGNRKPMNKIILRKNCKTFINSYQIEQRKLKQSSNHFDEPRKSSEYFDSWSETRLKNAFKHK